MRSRVIRMGIVAVMAGSALWAASGTASAGGGCHQAPSAGRGDAVEMQELCFVSTVLYVKPGSDVTWTNRDSMAHVVVGVGDTWGDPGISLFRGDMVSYRFDEDGVYPYSCLIHPGMVGAIVVGDGIGTSLTGVVPATGETVDAAADAAAPVAAGDTGTIVVWVAVALVLGGLAGAVAMRGRRRSVAAG